jgi:hypothetical protein
MKTKPTDPLMKRIVLIFAWAAGTVTLYARPVDSLSRSVIKISPQHFISHQLKFGLERFNASSTRSLVLYLNGALGNSSDNYYGYQGYTGIGGEFQYRTYLSPLETHVSRKDRAFRQGIYLAGFIQGGRYVGDFHVQAYTYDPVTQSFTHNTYDYRDDVGNWACGFTFGLQRTFLQRLFVEVFLGGGIQFSDRILAGQVPRYVQYGSPGISDVAYKGVLPKAGIHIGVGL